MNRKYMPLILMLFAGAVTCVITFVREDSLMRKMISLLIVLIIFYGLGTILRKVLDSFDRQNHKEQQPISDLVIEKEVENTTGEEE